MSESSIRQQIDPEGWLPQLTFRRNRRYPSLPLFYLQQTSGRDAGWVHIAEGVLEHSMEGIYVHKNKRGQGVGLATYLWAMERAHEAGAVFTTDSACSADAVKIWNVLRTTGVAAVAAEFGSASSVVRDGGYYSGLYYVPVPGQPYPIEYLRLQDLADTNRTWLTY